MTKEKNKTKNLHIRLSENDFDLIRKKALSSYLTVTDYVTKCCLEKQIFVIEGIDEVIRQQKYVGNNLNQLTRIANSGVVNVVGLDEVKNEYAKVTGKLNEILERGRWR